MFVVCQHFISLTVTSVHEMSSKGLPLSALKLLDGPYTQPFYGPLGFCPGLNGWAGTRKVKPIWIYWSKR